MLNEFKAFISKGNVLDLAVGIIIGAAFTAIVTSLVDDLIQPLIGMILGNIDFSAITLGQFKIGNFITAIIKFVIVAWVVFLLVKAMNKMMPKKEEALAAPAGPSDNDLLKEIVAQLKARPLA